MEDEMPYEAPPPVQQAEDAGWMHRRSTDDGDIGPIRHRRRTDKLLSNTKVQIGLFLTVLTLLSGAVAIGYSIRDFTRTVQGSGAVNDAQWTAINNNTQQINSLRGQQLVIASLVREIRCVLYAETEAERRNCQEEEAKRRLDASQGI